MFVINTVAWLLHKNWLFCLEYLSDYCLFVCLCSAPLLMHWRKQSIQTQTYIGRNLMRNTIFHANLQLTLSPWTIQISLSPVHTKRLQEGILSFCLVPNFEKKGYSLFAFWYIPLFAVLLFLKRREPISILVTLLGVENLCLET